MRDRDTIAAAAQLIGVLCIFVALSALWGWEGAVLTVGGVLYLVGEDLAP